VGSSFAPARAGLKFGAELTSAYFSAAPGRWCSTAMARTEAGKAPKPVAMFEDDPRRMSVSDE
jgi:hypothetical protein